MLCKTLRSVSHAGCSHRTSAHEAFTGLAARSSRVKNPKQAGTAARLSSSAGFWYRFRPFRVFNLPCAAKLRRCKVYQPCRKELGLQRCIKHYEPARSHHTSVHEALHRTCCMLIGGLGVGAESSTISRLPSLDSESSMLTPSLGFTGLSSGFEPTRLRLPCFADGGLDQEFEVVGSCLYL